MKFIIKIIKKTCKLLVNIVPTIALMSLCLYVFINFGLIKISGSSMEPTYSHDDLVFIQKNVNEYNKGDVVIVDATEYLMNELIIKRIIATEGETVEIIDAKVYVNGKVIQEEYISQMEDNENMDKVTLTQGEVFIMGDNRLNSTDSRIFGAVKIKDIEGKVVYDGEWFRKLGTLIP